MVAKVIAHTTEGESNKESLYELGGKFGAVCYVAGNYLDSKALTPNKNRARADRASECGHHSIFDHTSVTILFEGIPKMVAMMLNSLGAYGASERSARYTKMEPMTEVEGKSYAYWNKRIREIIIGIYPDLVDKADKLAQENARYMLSVFTPTTLIYTTVLKQWCYIVQWAKGMIDDISSKDIRDITFYDEMLLKGLSDLVCEVEPLIYTDSIRDTRKRGFNFIGNQSNTGLHNMYQVGNAFSEVYDYVYKIHYRGSLAMLAQAQRHRTLKYTMYFDGTSRDFYIPHIIEKYGTDGDKARWVADAKRLAKYIPQCTMVDIVERGCIEDFKLKCKDRLCGRAQLEVMCSTRDILNKMVMEYSNKGMHDILNILNEYVESSCAIPHCVKHRCIDGCNWGKQYGLDRYI